MKRFSAFFLLALSAVFSYGASPYGTYETLSRPEKDVFLFDKITDPNINEITYCIAQPEGKSGISDKNLDLHIKAAFKEWTYGMALRIKKEGRQEEFKDLIKILERKIEFKRIYNCDLSNNPKFVQYFPTHKHGQTADINFIEAPKYCQAIHGSSVTTAFFSMQPNVPPYICIAKNIIDVILYAEENRDIPTIITSEEKELVKQIPFLMQKIAYGKYTPREQDLIWKLNKSFFYDDDPTYFSIITHELGHAFALTDQYTSRGEDVLYSSSKTGQGLMMRGYESISCDEVDGIIAKFYKGKNKTFTRFCDENIKIKNGVEVTQKDTPVKLFVGKNSKHISILTPTSPENLTYKEERLIDNKPLNDEIRETLKTLNIDYSKTSPDTLITIYAKGLMKAGNLPSGTWQVNVNLEGKLTLVEVNYNEDGTINSVKQKPLSSDTMAKKIADFKNIDTSKIEKIIDETNPLFRQR
ncbi:hypothetical protein Emin_0771 [Elusimicrobium minutum Pei191]|uniref:Uncharacterized protein n=1 Tax=Elusimicrobium minutum (strain Pei191) TaxID=445932 RepID=B2KCT0_ELUMP|nr:hypothetical protein [Elusimicrobium minutum]ACC98326.1 hypothetical protein Emin_0771 [Elusimicrobium minutum Pei191]